MSLTIRPVTPRKPRTEKDIEEEQKRQFEHNIDNPSSTQ